MQAHRSYLVSRALRNLRSSVLCGWPSGARNAQVHEGGGQGKDLQLASRGSEGGEGALLASL